MTDPSAGTIKVTSSLLSCQSFGIRATQISEVWYKGAGNYNVHAWVIRPWNYKEGEKYPSALLIHGGPLQSWLHTWRPTWNPVLFAEQGYVVVMPNITGKFKIVSS
jgi:dipeptidyl aminopeptidase/acylaminoacyl peptidase